MKARKNTDKIDTNFSEENIEYYGDKNETPPAGVFAYNELRSCADLFRMHKDGILEIQPEYQRRVVWNPSDQSRFIDSLMKELPIPSMCFSLDFENKSWQVIDGLQRMATIVKFLSEPDWTISKLDDIDSRVSGKLVSEIEKNYPELYRRVENITLPITILRCDFSKPNHLEYIFMIFQRLNTGGLKLNNQEIRNAIFQGPFNNLLKECNKNRYWRVIAESKNKRFQDEELILRFFSFEENSKSYKGRLTSFLNEYMRENRNLDKNFIEDKKLLFEKTVNIVQKISGATTKKLSNVTLDALLFGVAKNLEHLNDVDTKKINILFSKLTSDKAFSTESISEGTLQKVKVMARLTKSAKIFSK